MEGKVRKMGQSCGLCGGGHCGLLAAREQWWWSGDKKCINPGCMNQMHARDAIWGEVFLRKCAGGLPGCFFPPSSPSTADVEVSLWPPPRLAWRGAERRHVTETIIECGGSRVLPNYPSRGRQLNPIKKKRSEQSPWVVNQFTFQATYHLQGSLSTRARKTCHVDHMLWWWSLID